MIQELINMFKKEQPKLTVNENDWISFNYSTDISLFYTLYDINPHVSACVNKISDHIGRYGYMIKYRKKEQPIELFAELVGTNLKLTTKEFFKRLTRDYLVAGNAYIHILKEKNTVVWLQILDPRYIKPAVTAHGKVVGYIQNINGIRAFDSDSVHHLRYDQDLDNESIGRSKIKSLQLDIQTEKEAQESNWALFNNNQIPSSIVVLDPDFSADISALTKLKSLLEWGNNRWGKSRNRTAVVQGVKQFIETQKKMDNVEFEWLRNLTIDIVCAWFNVPKNMLGYVGSSNRSEWDVQYENYWDMIESFENVFAEVITKILTQVYKKDYTFEFIQDNIRKLEKKSKVSVELLSGGIITQDEAREIVQYEPLNKKE